MQRATVEGREFPAIKPYAGVLHRKAYRLLSDKSRYVKGYISFKDVRQILSCLRPSKDDFFEFLKELEQAGFIEIVPYRGIKLKLKEGMAWERG